ncbi:thioredoxin family protein [Ferrimonas senticii]|uniref:thioredoxin family protein n=1 Tax=Ferrimonas senticii TaxID=394566 RepID=UPI0004831B09|nr:thioredoxin family protein [Ferrimonas senticii]
MRRLMLTALLSPLLIAPTYADSGCGFQTGERSTGLFATCTKEDSEVILTGLLNAEQLAQQPDYQAEYDRYQPENAVIAKLQQLSLPTEIVVILGTWCPDCHRETPRLAKVLAETANPQLKVSYIGVDRDKQDADGLAADYDFTRIPTIIVMQGGKEIGRIIERTTHSTELDLLDIVSQ